MLISVKLLRKYVIIIYNITKIVRTLRLAREACLHEIM